MSQLSLNQTNQSLVTDIESTRKTGFFRNSHSRAKNRSTTPKGNEDNISICTTGTGVHKLGYLPSYLKRETKSSVESELNNKYKKFKIAKKDLIQQQINLKQHYEQLRVLKEKFKRFGGRDFKIESLELIEFTGGGNDNRCGEGDHDIGTTNNSKAVSNCTDNQVYELEQVIQKSRGRMKDCLFKLIESNSELFKQIQESGIEKLKNSSQIIFSKIKEYVDTIINEHNVSTQYLLEKIRRVRIPFQETIEGHSTNDAAFQEEIVGLKKTVQGLEVKVKMLQSEIDVKNQEIEYMKNKESCAKNTSIDVQDEHQNELNELHLEIEAQKAVITDYSLKFDQYSKQQQMNKEERRQLEDKILELNAQLQDNRLKRDTDLCIEREKCNDLERMLSEVNKTKNENLEECSKLKGSQILTISELKKMLMAQGNNVAVEYSKDISPLQEEQTSKFTKQEKLIEKLENNKIRSNVLRDQLLDRISLLEKENEEMKVQIRKFQEDFTINRFMYDEQRRKKRLTEILVKQYQN